MLSASRSISLGADLRSVTVQSFARDLRQGLAWTLQSTRGYQTASNLSAKNQAPAKQLKIRSDQVQRQDVALTSHLARSVPGFFATLRSGLLLDNGGWNGLRIALDFCLRRRL